MTYHLYCNQCHDEAEVWCGARDYWQHERSDATAIVEKTTCVPCLLAATFYGDRVAVRLAEIRGVVGGK